MSESLITSLNYKIILRALLSVLIGHWDKQKFIAQAYAGLEKCQGHATVIALKVSVLHTRRELKLQLIFSWYTGVREGKWTIAMKEYGARLFPVITRALSPLLTIFCGTNIQKNTYTQPNLEERFPIFKQISTKWHSFKTDTDRGKYTKLTVAKQV